MKREDFFQQALLLMAGKIMDRATKTPTPEQLAEKALEYTVELHNRMLAGLTQCDIFETTNELRTRETKPGAPTLAPVRQPSGEAPSCPKCSGLMKYRTGRFGSFWGCTGFPDCRGIVNLKEEES